MTENQQRQFGEFLENCVSSAVQAALEQVVPELDKEGARQVIERGDELKAGVKKALVDLLRRISKCYPVLSETRLLKPVATATSAARTNAAEFFQNRPGLNVYDTFADRLDPSARKTAGSAPERPYVASLLKANACDRDIRKELPEEHLSAPEDIAGFIEAQPEGKRGFLLTNGYANIFYAKGHNGEVFAVHVRWFSDCCQWGVFDWDFDEVDCWNAGDRVLCPGNMAL